MDSFSIAKTGDGKEIQLLTAMANRHGLITGATGTGKTVIAAVDYARLRTELRRSRLLFVAHREEIIADASTVRVG